MPRDYVQGKKIRYVPPMRLYLFISFFYFLILNAGVGLMMNSANLNRSVGLKDSRNYKTIVLNQDLHRKSMNMDRQQLLNLADSVMLNSKQEDLTANEWKFLRNKDAIDSIYTELTDKTIINFGIVEAVDRKSNALGILVKPQYDSIYVQDKKYAVESIQEIHENPDFATELEANDGIKRSIIDSYVHRSMLRMTAVFKYGTSAEKKSFVENRMRALLNYFSYSMFFIMPIASLIFMLFYFYRYKKYYEHFVHAVSLHTFMFMVLGIFFGITVSLYRFFDLEWWPFILILACIFGFYIAVYFINSVYIFYQTSIRRAILSSLLMGIIYSILFFFILALVMAMAMIL